MSEVQQWNNLSLRLLPESRPCVVCQNPASYADELLAIPLCSESCHREAWRKQNEFEMKVAMEAHVQKYRPQILEELQYANDCVNKSKDIVVVIHNQLEYVKVCLNSIVTRTQNYKLYLWDNGSDVETEEFLREFQKEHAETVVLTRSETNRGFVEPNNEVAAWGDGEYLILLNSDTQVFVGWDRAMLGYLQHHSDVAEVGYLGGLLLPDGRGEGGDFGEKIDYIAGFCACLPRSVYQQHGLFSLPRAGAHRTV